MNISGLALPEGGGILRESETALSVLQATRSGERGQGEMNLDASWTLVNREIDRRMVDRLGI